MVVSEVPVTFVETIHQSVNTECRICHKPLTNPTSVARGIGPECILGYMNECVGQGDMFSLRSKYSYTIRNGNIICLVDEGHGAVKTLTNDMDTVLQEVERELGDLTMYTILYQDIHQEWFGVNYKRTQNGVRVSFYNATPVLLKANKLVAG